MMRQKLSPAESIHVLNVNYQNTFMSQKLPESIHASKVIYQNPSMCEKLITRIHSCVKFYLPESIHVSKVIYKNPSICVKSYLPDSIHVSNSPNPGVCLLRCSQVFGSLQCRDVVAPELNKWCRSKSLSFHYYHRVRCSYNMSIQRSYPTYPHISMVI